MRTSNVHFFSCQKKLHKKIDFMEKIETKKITKTIHNNNNENKYDLSTVNLKKIYTVFCVYLEDACKHNGNEKQK